MRGAQTLRDDEHMRVERLSLDGIPIVPETDILSMTRAMTKVRAALGVSQDEAASAVSQRLVGGVMPDVSLSQLEALAAAGGARVCVTLETEDGRSLNLAHIL